MIKINVFHTGSVVVNKAVPYKSKNPLAPYGVFESKKARVTLPVSAYLIRHPKGNVLFDTGWNTALATTKYGRFCGAVDKMSHAVITPDGGIADKLNTAGVSPDELDFVVFSHLDLDHISGAPLVKDAKEFLVSEEEWEGAKKHSLRYDLSLLENIVPQLFRFENLGVGPVGKAKDLFGDGSVMLVNTPGHSLGHTSLLVRGSEKFVILAGDSIYSRENLENRHLMGFCMDKNLAYRTIDWLNEMSSDKNCLAILPNHDPETAEREIIL